MQKVDGRQEGEHLRGLALVELRSAKYIAF